MTETHHCSKSGQIRKAASGKPMPGTEVRIVDKDESGIGEVICKGPSAMMGYYKDERIRPRLSRMDGYIVWKKTMDIWMKTDSFI